MADAKDYYSILGVSKTATDAEIKRAYRKMALQYHPDRNKTKEADTKFKEVTKAYEVLGDEQKRKTYDQFGSAAFEQGGMGGGNPFSGFGGFGGGQGGQSGQYGPFSYTYTTNGGAQDFGGFSDPFEIFEQFFGGGFSRQRRSVYSVTIPFMEAVRGAEKKVSINGKQQTIKIPKGVDNGSRIRFNDFDVVVEVMPDKRYRREGADVITDEEISFSKAAIGTELPVQTLEGEVTLRIPAGTQPDTVLRLRGKGVPRLRGSGNGDHYVRIKVVVPKSLSKRQKELLEEFDSENSKKSRWF